MTSSCDVDEDENEDDDEDGDEDCDEDGDEDDKDEDKLLAPGILVIPVRVCNFSATISASKSH